MSNFKTIDFSKFTSVKIGPILEVEILNENSNFNGVVIGGGNNILMSNDNHKLGILDDKFDFIYLENDILRIGAKAKSKTIYNFAKENNIANFEFVRNIPGTLGGMLSMNAGLLGSEISDNLISSNTNNGTFSKEDLKFGYRKSEINGIIFEASFKIKFGFDEILDNNIFSKRVNQPKGKCFGSCFTNPVGNYAGKLLEEVGLKGFRIGNVGFSEKHANFLINYGDGNFEDAKTLIELAKKKVKDKFGILLNTEVKIIDKSSNL